MARHAFEQIVRTNIRGHNDHGIFKIHRPALGIGHPPIIENLQQDVKDIVVRLLDFIKEDNRIGLATHRFGELAAFLVPDIPRRRTNEPGDGMPLHVLAHVDAYHVLFGIEQRLSQRLGEFGLPYTGRPKEDERANRPARVFNPSAGANHGIGHQTHRLILAYDALMQNLVEAQKLVTLPFN